MSRFIPGDKLKQLREAYKNGDARAKAVLMAQMDATSDFDGLFNDYFKPAETKPEIEVSGEEDAGSKMLRNFLSSNGVREGDPDYDETVEMFYQEFPKYDHRHDSDVDCCEEPAKKLEEPEMIDAPRCDCMSLVEQLKKLIADENEAISGYNNAIMIVTNDPEMSVDEKTVMITTLKSINDDEMQHVSILMDKLKKYDKKEQKEISGKTEMDEVPEGII